MDFTMDQGNRLWSLLQVADDDLAAAVQLERCLHCGCRLDQSNYPRKPRGGPSGLSSQFSVRFSFCCSAEGCRRRTTPPSLRFLGRRVYLGCVVVLLSSMLSGVTPRRAAQLRQFVGTSQRTLERWRQWWLETFPATAVWRAIRGQLAGALDPSALPGSLLERCLGDDPVEGMVRLLRLLSPLTTTSYPMEAGLKMAL